MLEALRKKAEAFSNDVWTQYWATHGPSLLATGWMNVYPYISLERLQNVCSLNFLAETMNQLGLEGTGDQQSTPEDLAMDEVNSNRIGHDNTSPGESTESCNDVLEESNEDEKEIQFTCPTDEEILRLWSEHYNSYYWYSYQVFCHQADDNLALENGHGEPGEVRMEGEEEGGEELESDVRKDLNRDLAEGCRDELVKELVEETVEESVGEVVSEVFGGDGTCYGMESCDNGGNNEEGNVLEGNDVISGTQAGCGRIGDDGEEENVLEGDDVDMVESQPNKKKWTHPHSNENTRYVVLTFLVSN